MKGVRYYRTSKHWSKVTCSDKEPIHVSIGIVGECIAKKENCYDLPYRQYKTWKDVESSIRFEFSSRCDYENLNKG